MATTPQAPVPSHATPILARAGQDDAPAARVMALLDRGVPLSLLCDLVSRADPDSAAINSVERPAEDTIWLEAAETLWVRFRSGSA